MANTTINGNTYADLGSSDSAFPMARPASVPYASNVASPQVKLLQQQLNSKGANLKVDGLYGPLTAAAQAKYGATSAIPANSNTITKNSMGVWTGTSPTTGTTGDSTSGTPASPMAPTPVNSQNNQTTPTQGYSPFTMAMTGLMNNLQQQAGVGSVNLSAQQGKLINQSVTSGPQFDPSLGSANAGIMATAQKGFDPAIAGMGNYMQTYSQNADRAMTAMKSAQETYSPTLGAPGQTQYYPFQGSQGGLDAATMLQYAQMAVNGQMAGIPASITGNPVLNSQLLSMAKQLNPNFNFNQAAGTGTAQTYNTATSSSAGVDAAKAVFSQATNDVFNLNQNVINVDQFGKLLTSGSGGINPFDLKYANYTLAQFRNTLSSSAQAQFNSTMAALKSKISGLLATGGNEIPTQISNDAQKILDDSASMGSIQATLQRIQLEGQLLLQNATDKANNAYVLMNTSAKITPNTTQGTNQNTNTSGGFSWDLLNHP